VVTRPLCVVTGAGGALGPVVVREFASAGFAVRALGRAPLDRSVFPEGVELAVADILDFPTLRSGISGADTVVHMAALLHVVHPAPSLVSEYQRINVGGTRNVMRAAAETGVRRVVLTSTIAVYGYGSGGLLDEESIPAPSTMYAASKLEAEEVALAAAVGPPLATILRLSAVYGARAKGNYRRLIRALSKGFFVGVGNGENRRTLVHERDAARAAVIASGHPGAAGRIFNVTDGQFHTVREIVDAISRSVGRRSHTLFVPAAPARLAAGMIESGFRAVGHRAPINRATIDKFTEDVAVDGSRIQHELGFRPALDLAGGWAETIAEMRRAGDL
jgi:nucleoside-diphosphate-sugar epimerase